MFKRGAGILNSVSISDESYLLTWDLLHERFENKQFIVHNHIHALFSLNHVKRDSYKSLRELLVNVNWHLRSLEQLELPTKHWDDLVIYLICTKLDAASEREWDTAHNVNELPKLEKLFAFLNQRCRQLEKTNPMTDNHSSSKSKTNSLISANHPNCNYCNQSHFISRCDSFLKLTVNNRIDEIKKKRLCLNCLGKGHNIAGCKSKYSFKRCNKKHHSLLHIEQTALPKANLKETAKSVNEASTTVAHVAAKNEINQILLSTAYVRVSDAAGSWHHCKAILDSGSQSNFITHIFLKKLNLNSIQIQSRVVGINQATVNLDRWILSGPLSVYQPQQQQKLACYLSANLEDQLIERFWSIEECDSKRNWSLQEHECETHFNKTTTRDPTGRFVVSIPFTSNKNRLGASRHMALKRFYAMERRLNQDIESKRDYVEFLADIEKMYRQILLSGPDRKYHRIFWRSDAAQSVQCYELQTITYGTASASYLATRCLQQLAIDYNSHYPEACLALNRDFYVDDLLTGANSLDEINKLHNDLINILSSAGLNLRKWLSNSANFKNCNESDQIQLGDNSETRTLGISWSSSLDIFKYEIAKLPCPKRVTKRAILATTAKIFDPLGLLGPVIVKAKLIMQQLWLSKLSCDESISQDIYFKWIKFQAKLIMQQLWLSGIHFFANRVAKIQSITNAQEWAHVKSQDNPADLISRGAAPTILIESTLWWHGPTWLAKKRNEWPSEASYASPLEQLPELRKTILMSNVNNFGQVKQATLPLWSSYQNCVKLY
ncbi:Pao retrotransposon peptidase [Popillia japonica]|uniref:Pao retrotransposon peptidase n=1 Tax=Popillia japonica TaxID=7064 RepID=A0AAW1JJC6_POPJA